MGLFKCAKCGCVDNTALGHFHCRTMVDQYDWTGLEEFKGKALCYECQSTYFSDGTISKKKEGWHNRFPKRHISEYTEEQQKEIYGAKD